MIWNYVPFRVQWRWINHLYKCKLHRWYDPCLRIPFVHGKQVFVKLIIWKEKHHINVFRFKAAFNKTNVERRKISLAAWNNKWHLNRKYFGWECKPWPPLQMSAPWKGDECHTQHMVVLSRFNGQVMLSSLNPHLEALQEMPHWAKINSSS